MISTIGGALDVAAGGVRLSFTTFGSLWEIAVVVVCSVQALYLVAIFLKKEETGGSIPPGGWR